MRLIQFEQNGKLQWGELLPGEEVCLNFTRISGAPDLRAYLNQAVPLSLRVLHSRSLAQKEVVPLRQARLLVPVFPGTVFGVGCNFRNTSRKQKVPILFLKATQSLTAHRTKVRVPSFLREVYAEVELGVVIGRGTSVFGYTVVNDVTARGLDHEDIWFYRKSYSTFTPAGPWITTRDSVRNPMRLNLCLDVNGQRRLTSNTTEMIFSVKDVIVALGRNLNLAPGDLIMMGCPGLAEPLRHGDTVRMEVEGVGVLENAIGWKRK